MNFKTNIIPTWCPGCSNYLLSSGIQQTLTKLNVSTSDLVIAYDIGCAGNMADFINSFGAHTLHGRCIPFAIGAKVANPSLTVCAVGGDGGIYGEGLNHLIAAARMNIDITVFVANNHLYSLTTGQTSPTTAKGTKTKSTPLGAPGVPLDPVKLVKAVNPEVFAETVDSKDVGKLNELIESAMKFRGFSLLDTAQFCLAFGK
ncbi:MAG: thiamine pyrophosphate-dependent enzyme [Candidatus Shapirobacteria bacterium]|jgi:2-oxoglutarate ferredoxin oxidoreductase subunit beta